MITKQEFADALRKGGINVTGDELEFETFENCVNAAVKIKDAMPGIGFASAAKRINCFLAVCRHLDELMDDEEIDLSDSQIILIILRLKDKTFNKAISMFELHGPRFRAMDRADLPKPAREYLAGLEMFG